MTSYDIKFVGPVQPKDWPLQHAHLFKIISEISEIRYDRYKDDHRFTRRNRERNRERARVLRGDTDIMKRNGDETESTWRKFVEGRLNEKFCNSAKCDRCHGEKWQSDFIADPQDEQDKHDLSRKRKRRKLCRCVVGVWSEGGRLEDSDDQEDIKRNFHLADDSTVKHDPETDILNAQIRPKPDSIVGLIMLENYRRYLINEDEVSLLKHCPLANIKLLYPFMVFEAKRELNAPGFRAIEAQTAFPIFKLLKLQNGLRDRCKTKLEPLVWFLGYQGPICQLYGAIIVDNVVVFSLWLGSLESLDGSLQLILIMDFIWTWARDIYRRCIRNCLREHAPGSLSPTSTVPNRRSESVFSDHTAYRETPNIIKNLFAHNTSTEALGKHSLEPVVQGGELHPLVRWSRARETSRDWNRQTSCRHSDVSECTFSFTKLPNDPDLIENLLGFYGGNIEHRNTLLLMFRYIFMSGQVILWTQADFQALEHELLKSSGNSAIRWTQNQQEVFSFIFFRTYIRSKDWQVMRELCCFAWPYEFSRIVTELTNTTIVTNSFEFSEAYKPSDAIQDIARVFHIFGADSVDQALNDACLTLTRKSKLGHEVHQLDWTSQSSDWEMVSAVKQLNDLLQLEPTGNQAFLDLSIRDRKLAWLHHQTSIDEARTNALGPNSLSEEEGEAMLVVKPSSWPPHSPRFCLFVLRNVTSEIADMKRYLEYGIKDIWGVNTLSEEDKFVLEQWMKAWNVKIPWQG